jgi:hypothetical protein
MHVSVRPGDGEDSGYQEANGSPPELRIPKQTPTLGTRKRCHRERERVLSLKGDDLGHLDLDCKPGQSGPSSTQRGNVCVRMSCSSTRVHILTEESELPVTRRPPDPESAEIGRECACTVAVFLHWRRWWHQRDYADRRGLSYIVQFLPEPDLPLVVCAHEKVIAQKSHAGHQTLVTCQSLIDTRVTLVLENRRVSAEAKQWKNGRLASTFQNATRRPVPNATRVELGDTWAAWLKRLADAAM